MGGGACWKSRISPCFPFPPFFFDRTEKDLSEGSWIFGQQTCFDNLWSPAPFMETNGIQWYRVEDKKLICLNSKHLNKNRRPKFLELSNMSSESFRPLQVCFKTEKRPSRATCHETGEVFDLRYHFWVTVDWVVEEIRRSPADMVNITQRITEFYTSQVVIAGSLNHQQYVSISKRVGWYKESKYLGEI